MNSSYSVVLMCQLLKRMNRPVASDFKCRAASLIFYSSEMDACLCQHWVKNIQIWLSSSAWAGGSGQSQILVAAYGETLATIKSTNKGFLLYITVYVCLGELSIAMAGGLSIGTQLSTLFIVRTFFGTILAYTRHNLVQGLFSTGQDLSPKPTYLSILVVGASMLETWDIGSSRWEA